MKYFFIIFLFSLQASAQEGVQEIFSPFNTTNRCRELLKTREDKLKFISKLEALNQRSLKLTKTSVKEKRLGTHEKLMLTKKRIEKELLTAKMGLKNMEEDIIRKGCPGVQL